MVGLVVDYQSQIGRTGVIIRRVEIDSHPIATAHGDHATEHFIGIRNRKPIILAVKRSLGGTNQINGKVAFDAISGIEERYAGNLARSSQFAGGVDLLRQGIRIVGIGREITVVGNRFAYNTAAHLLEIRHILGFG